MTIAWRLRLWVHGNIAKLGGNPARLAIGGDRFPTVNHGFFSYTAIAKDCEAVAQQICRDLKAHFDRAGYLAGGLSRAVVSSLEDDAFQKHRRHIIVETTTRFALREPPVDRPVRRV